MINQATKLVTNTHTKIVRAPMIWPEKALDDFGTGYSSLSYLRDLPLNVLKIDKSFIDNINHQQSKELVRSIIAIGKHMKLLTVAEGTESKEQVEMLKEMGCDYFQGYFFSRPLTAEAFEAYAMN